MDICFIGNSGHSGYVLNCFNKENKDNSLKVTGYAPGYKEENIYSIGAQIKNLGYEAEEFTDYRKMLKAKKPHIAIVDSIFADHAKITTCALEEGCHVLCDKPLATDIHELEKLYKSSQKFNRIIVSMMTMRYDSAFYTVKEMIENNEIGIVRQISAQKSYKLGERPEFYTKRKTFGGFIPWIAIHGVDLCTWLTGKKINMLSAFHSAKENYGYGELEITASCQMLLEDDVIATVNADYLRPSGASSHGDDRIRVAGIDGTIEVIGDVIKKIDKNGERVINHIITPNLLSDFLNCINGVSTLLTQDDSFYSTYAALCLRNAADDMRTYRMGELFK